MQEASRVTKISRVFFVQEQKLQHVIVNSAAILYSNSVSK